MSRGRNNGPSNAGEKPKDLKKSIIKLTKYLKTFMPFIIVALIFAALSSVCSIIGPNKTSDLTNKISEGLIVNQDNFEKITKEITNSFDKEKINEVSKKLLNIKIDSETLTKIENDKSIDTSLKEDFLKKLYTNNLNEIVFNTDEKILNYILPTSTINDIEITTNEKIKYLEVIKNYNDKENKNIAKDIPDNILLLFFDDSIIDGKVVSSKDKVKFIKQVSNLDEKSSVGEIYKTLDKSPNSIKNLVKPKMDLKGITKIAIILLILYLVSALFNLFQSFIMATVSNNFAKRLRDSISKKINKLPLKFFDEHSTGDILSIVTNDVDTINMSLYNSLGSLVGAITLFVGSIIMMFVTNYLMAITAILSCVFGFVFVITILSKSQKYFIKRQVELGKLNGHIEEIYSNHNVVKAYNGEADAKEKFDKLNYSVYDCNRKSQFLSGLMGPFMNFIGNFSYVCVCVVGALLVVNGNISFGVIVAFMIYIRLFTNPLSQIAQGLTQLQTTLAASERVFNFLEEKEMPIEDNLTKKLDKDKVKGSIEFKHVKFGYDDNKLIIKDFNCKVSPGQKVAIVGPTGAGKTTIVNLLMKFYEINDGDILIDNTSIKDLTRENIHDLFIMVLQDTWVFNGSIRDNVKYNNENITDKEIFKALETVGIKHFIKSLPGGLDYELNDQESISGGQKQLLTIARGMLSNSPFLILDEATSSVDTRTEELVQKSMDELTKGRTSFIIAHRLSTIKNADIILVLKDGNIIEQGNHEELMEQDGFYKELYNSQFKN